MSFPDDNTYWIDHASNSDFTAGVVSLHPENLKFDDTISGVGNCSYEISFSALDSTGAAIVTGHDFIGPYRHYYRLRYGNTCIMSGPIVSWHTGYGDDFMSVAGKTWEHELERWMYPFDPRPTPTSADPDAPVNMWRQPNTYRNDEVVGGGAPTPTGLVYQAYNRDVIRILSDILSVSMNIGYRVIFDISRLANLSGVKSPTFQFTLGDTTTMDQLANQLAETGDGFDWWISWDKVFYWATPARYGNPNSPAIFYTLDYSTDAKTPDSLAFTNNGPAATHVLGTGAGLASQTKLGRAYGLAGNQATFTRLDAAYDFGDVRNVSQLISKTKRQLSIDLQPQHEISLTIDPSRISTFWSEWRKGRAIWITAEMTAHLLDSAQRLKSYSATVDANGQASVDFTLEQINPINYSIGDPEG